ncbi:MAG: DNA internalization-related competence protein ComEC/Rec2 [Candidatus Marinimicrobia bacterium]|nr:DNA internalization-related competence protein ComEC/Rec2 [Candidatus Neomarinimicrobiota bacterium]MBT4536579.1 DNA internalization-related competence protein ComEC/Rec2 [Candidatus Neomarinimicrobiota bacterium]MBT5537699.1 DNA internalization-related competence protein ComEC/Rec2 [Candidatus Neomarinimicrobiota bacterium]MBT6215280.1 DNA internalization-related competence protein ComEC/Rec2 [Candidatus Neomarinimicrobiota bacterium]MBT7882407.1 DNA internalization-related competence prote
MKFLILQIMAILFANHFIIPIFSLIIIIILSVILSTSRYYILTIPVIVVSIISLRCQLVALDYFEDEIEIIDQPLIVKYVAGTGINQKLTLGLTSLNGDIIFSRKEAGQNFLPGDTLWMSGILIIPDYPTNPGQFNYRQYLLQKGITSILVKGEINRFSEGPWSLGRLFTNWRFYAGETINKNVDEPFSGIVKGLIIGDRLDIDDGIKKRFMDIGIVHILAVSGLHVGYIYLILSLTGKILRMPPKAVFIFISIGLIFYMGLTGFTVSVIRAGIMAILYSWGKMREKNINPWNIVIFSAIFVLYLNPYQYDSPGFLLSYGAVSGILFSYSRLVNLICLVPLLKRSRSNKFIRGVIDLVLVTISAQVGTLIPSSVFFHTIPVWGILANLLIVFLSGIAVISGILTVLTNALSSIIPDLFGETAWFTLFIMNHISMFISDLPFRHIYLGEIPLILMSLIFITILLWISSINIKVLKLAIFSTLMILNIFMWKSMIYIDSVKFWFLDVGQGDACVIIDGKNTILIDAGYAGFGKDYGKYAILPFLKSEGINQLDLAVMTHPHADHIGGFRSIMKDIEVKAVWDTRNDYQSSLYDAIKLKCVEDEIPIDYPEPGNIYQIGRIRITILYPNESLSKSVHNINNASIVFRIDVDKDSFLFTGDIEKEGERYLYKLDEIKNVDLIKLGHHGSITSSTEKLCQLVRARFGIVSLGKNNKYGHPSIDVLERWESVDTYLYRTDLRGAVLAETDGKGLRLTAMKK